MDGVYKKRKNMEGVPFYFLAREKRVFFILLADPVDYAPGKLKKEENVFACLAIFR